MIRKHITLKRELGLFEATVCGVGIIVGAGIYALLGIASGIAGNSVWLSFFLASLIAMFTGLSYAELSSMYPKDASEYLYTKEAFGKALAFITGWLLIMSGTVIIAAVSMAFAGYLTVFIQVPYLLAAVGLIILMALINYSGIKQSVHLNILFTFLEVFGLILIIYFGFKQFGAINYFEMPNGFKGLFEASALVFFAFLGFESVVKLAEETKNPEKTIPKAVILSIIITTVIYILAAGAAVTLVDWQSLGLSQSPIADVARAAMGHNGFLILGVIALFSTANTVLISQITASRITYGMADTGSLPRFLSFVSSKTRTPVIAIVIISLLSILFTFINDLTIVANITNASVFITFMLINGSVILLRYKKPRHKRPFKVPLTVRKFALLPFLGIISSLFMLFNIKALILLYTLGIITLGWAVHLLYEKYHS